MPCTETDIMHVAAAASLFCWRVHVAVSSPNCFQETPDPVSKTASNCHVSAKGNPTGMCSNILGMFHT